jgi:uncharacterized repeat protein (TIGR01451 family)
MKRFGQIALIAFLGALAANALAQDEGHLLVRTVVQKEQVIVDENGEQKVELVDASTVIPGDEVIYTVTFQNISDQAADNVVITNPIAGDLEYVDGSAFGPGSEIVFSVDGGTVFASATELTVEENGVARSARPGDFTHIRWQMRNEIPAGSQGVARIRAKQQ